MSAGGHTFIPSTDEGAPEIDPSHTRAIKQWAREVLKLSDDDVVWVNESTCVDPGCPLVETTVSVHSGQPERQVWRFTRPRVTVTKMMVQQTLSTPAQKS